LDSFVLEEKLPEVEVLLSVSADVGELRLRKRLRMIIRTQHNNGRITHILAYSIPNAKMCLAVFEQARPLDRLVAFTVLSVGLDELVAELDPSLDNCLLTDEVLEKN
jgi:hypothetical protein